MGNEVYMYLVQKDYWSASTSPSETPRHSFAENDPFASSSSSSTSSYVIGEGNLEYPGYDSTSNGLKLDSSNLKSFKFKELKIATSEFARKNLLGESNFGEVFKGWIDQNKLNGCKPGRGIPVAIRRLTQQPPRYQEWLDEYFLFGQLFHPNLVSLIGYCSYKTELLLVFEFMALGSLDKHLFNGDRCLLTWSIRMKVALQIAKALAFLHKTEINILHLGVASFTVLLDSSYNAKLSNIGLSIPGPTDNASYASPTQLRGVVGYLDPEFHKSGIATAKSDVYSFGVVLLEILSGRKAVEMQYQPESVSNLVLWARARLNEGKTLDVLDPRLDGNFSPELAQIVANVALQCVATEGKFRPDMDRVVTTLECGVI